jgi:PTH2 family peptidyl-tRNA hydrolase
VKCKVVLVVRTDLDMGRGKIAAQAAHAAVAAALSSLGSPEFEAWADDGQPKVVCRVDGADELYDIVQQATEAGVPAGVIHDAGRTQVEAGTPTCAFIGPERADRIDEITGELRLL